MSAGSQLFGPAPSGRECVVCENGGTGEVYIADGVAPVCLHPAECYHINVTGPSSARWLIHDASGTVVVEGTAPFSQEVCHCGHHGGISCSDCTITPPAGGGYGDCPANGTLSHESRCVATCGNESGLLPMSRWKRQCVAVARRARARRAARRRTPWRLDPWR